MSKAKLKRQLQSLDHAQIMAMVLELYDIRRDAREYLDFWADPDPEKAVEKAEKEVRKIFHTTNGKPRRRPSMTDLNTIVKHFMTLGLDPDRVGGFLLHVAETQAEWLSGRVRRMTYRSSMFKNLTAARLYIENAWPDSLDRDSAEALTDNPFAIRYERLAAQVGNLFYY